MDSQNRRIDNIQRGRKPGLFDELFIPLKSRYEYIDEQQ
jgi:hypothetical protein